MKVAGWPVISEQTLGHRAVLALRSHVQKVGRPGRNEQPFPQGLTEWLPKWANEAQRFEGEGLDTVLEIMRERNDSETIQDTCACIIWGTGLRPSERLVNVQ
jgi:hypothetical protein